MSSGVWSKISCVNYFSGTLNDTGIGQRNEWVLLRANKDKVGVEIEDKWLLGGIEVIAIKVLNINAAIVSD